MKKWSRFVWLVVLCLLAHGLIDLNAQEIGKQRYKPTPETKKFEGTWVFESKDSKLKLDLKNYEKFFLKDVNAFADIVKGEVVYKKAGKIVYDNKNAILNGRTGESMPFELWATFKDPSGRGGKLILKFDNPKDTNTLNLKIIPRNHLDASKYPPIKIPESITLKREKKV